MDKERKAIFENCLVAAKEDYIELEKQVKSLGIKINALAQLIRGLSVYLDVPIPPDLSGTKRTIVVTKESRELTKQFK